MHRIARNNKKLFLSIVQRLRKPWSKREKMRPEIRAVEVSS